MTRNQAAMQAVDESELMEAFEKELTQETAQVVPLPRSVEIHKEAAGRHERHREFCIVMLVVHKQD